jgi:HK97 family phage portal protein
MNLFRKAMAFWSSDARTVERVFVDASGTSDSGEYVSDRSALALSSVWACVNLLAGTVATLPLMIYRTVPGKTREPYPDHPLYRILHDSPNADQTASDFWEFSEIAIELRGNAYARKLRSSTRIIGLDPIPPGAMAPPRRLASGSIEYRWTVNGKSFVADDRDVLHIRGFGGDPLGGLSTLEFARNTFGLARAIDRAAGTTFKNGVRPAGVLTFEKFLSEQNRQIAETALVEKYAGAMNAGRPLILEGGSTWQQISINPEDAQMLESRSYSVEEICRFFGVPPFMIGHTEKATSWGSGLEQQVLAFRKFTLQRRLERIEQALMKQLLTPEDRAQGVTIEFNLEGLLRADSVGRAAYYQSGLTNGWLTINEVRAKENLPPVAGGEVPRMQSQNVPITQAGQGANDGNQGV